MNMPKTLGGSVDQSGANLEKQRPTQLNGVQLAVIDFGGDNWVALWPYMRHKTTALLQKNMRKYMKPRGNPVLLSGLTPETNLINDYEIDTVALAADQHEQNDIKILNQVVEWSAGPVTQATLDDMPTPLYDKLVAEVDRLYADAPLAGQTAPN